MFHTSQPQNWKVSWEEKLLFAGLALLYLPHASHCVPHPGGSRSEQGAWHRVGAQWGSPHPTSSPCWMARDSQDMATTKAAIVAVLQAWYWPGCWSVPKPGLSWDMMQGCSSSCWPWASSWYLAWHLSLTQESTSAPSWPCQPPWSKWVGLLVADSHATLCQGLP